MIWEYKTDEQKTVAENDRIIVLKYPTHRNTILINSFVPFSDES